MLLEKIRFESGKTLYFRPHVEDLPLKIKKSMPECRVEPNAVAQMTGKPFNILLKANLK
ncbi:hypothetical protein [Polaromonas sp. CG9_12]|uniref:hypothetical protein n=1 Tax=Polaromonas sp. CG_9.11 TaxID=2787730 RepID=UPI0004DDCF3D|nr:hypothetical protein [Polaromonas sp. CG_9.11]MBG6074973.1 hypothetical protein [Polaromonas sp. CG_9.11]CDS54969.1 hypothetical protein [Polaromonas sp. CG9_12]